MRYATDSHLLSADGEVFSRDDRETHREALQRASQDVERDLRGKGYLRDAAETLVDDSASATVSVTMTAHAAGDVSVPAGAAVYLGAEDVGCPGVVHFLVVTGLVIPAGTSAAVDLVASAWGAPYNIEAGALGHADVVGVEAVAQALDAAGGVDHQLARATVYRALELLYGDLMRVMDDAFDAKRKLYREMYRDEFRRLIAAGVEVDGAKADAVFAAFSGFERS